MPAPTRSVAVSAVGGAAALPSLEQPGQRPPQYETQGDDESDEKDSYASSDADGSDDDDGSEWTAARLSIGSLPTVTRPTYLACDWLASDLLCTVDSVVVLSNLYMK